MTDEQNKFQIGDAVLVAQEKPNANPRTPKYIRGKRGVVEYTHDRLENTRDHRGIHDPLYTVRFDLSEVSTCRDAATILVDVHEEWLQKVRQDS